MCSWPLQIKTEINILVRLVSYYLLALEFMINNVENKQIIEWKSNLMGKNYLI